MPCGNCRWMLKETHQSVKGWCIYYHHNPPDPTLTGVADEAYTHDAKLGCPKYAQGFPKIGWISGEEKSVVLFGSKEAREEQASKKRKAGSRLRKRIADQEEADKLGISLSRLRQRRAALKYSRKKEVKKARVERKRLQWAEKKDKVNARRRQLYWDAKGKLIKPEPELVEAELVG